MFKAIVATFLLASVVQAADVKIGKKKDVVSRKVTLGVEASDFSKLMYTHSIDYSGDKSSGVEYIGSSVCEEINEKHFLAFLGKEINLLDQKSIYYRGEVANLVLAQSIRDKNKICLEASMTGENAGSRDTNLFPSEAEAKRIFSSSLEKLKQEGKLEAKANALFLDK